MKGFIMLDVMLEVMIPSSIHNPNSHFKKNSTIIRPPVIGSIQYPVQHTASLQI